MQVLSSGNCEFAIIKDKSAKTGRDYTYIKIKFGDYEYPSFIFPHFKQWYQINKNIDKPIDLTTDV